MSTTKGVQFLKGVYNSRPLKSVAGQKLLAPTKGLEIFPAIGRISTRQRKTLGQEPGCYCKPSKLLHQFVVFVEAYPYAKKSASQLNSVLEYIRFNIEDYFWKAQVCLTTPMDWIKEMYLSMPNYMQKINFIPTVSFFQPISHLQSVS